MRSLQRETISKQETWLHRHTGASSEHILQSSHDAITGTAEATEKRSKRLMDVLTPVQKAKFLVWMAQKKKSNAQKLIALMTSRFSLNEPVEDIKTDAQRHDAANLYILNHKLTLIAKAYPCANPKVLSAKALQRFTRRPAFESLATIDDVVKGAGPKKGRQMSRDASSASLKRCASEMSCDDVMDRSFLETSTSGTSLCGGSSITPEAAQATCSAHVYQALGSIRNLIPIHRLARQGAGQSHCIQPAPVVSSIPLMLAQRQSLPNAAPLATIFSNQQITFVHYDSQPHQTIAPAPFPSTGLNPIPDAMMSASPEEQRITPYQSSQVMIMAEPVPIAALSNANAMHIHHPALIKPIISTAASAPAFNGFNAKVPSPLLSMSNDAIGGFALDDDLGFWNVSNQMADDSLFELTEEDWAIGEGAFLE